MSFKNCIRIRIAIFWRHVLHTTEVQAGRTKIYTPLNKEPCVNQCCVAEIKRKEKETSYHFLLLVQGPHHFSSPTQPENKKSQKRAVRQKKFLCRKLKGNIDLNYIYY